jgi:hypothetical protein
MKLRFVRLPDALEPLVGRFGDPFVQITETMSVFSWFTAPGTQLFTTNDAGELRVIELDPPDDDRGILVRANEAGDPRPRSHPRAGRRRESTRRLRG